MWRACGESALRLGGVSVYHNIMEEPKASFFSWKYVHYFTFVKQKEKNVYVKCNLCLGTKNLSTAANSNSNLAKHLGTQHAATKLVANAKCSESGTGTDTDTDVASPRAPKQQRLSCSFQRGSATASQAKVNQVIAGYVVEDMQPISTVESPAFRRIINLIPGLCVYLLRLYKYRSYC